MCEQLSGVPRPWQNPPVRWCSDRLGCCLPERPSAEASVDVCERDHTTTVARRRAIANPPIPAVLLFVLRPKSSGRRLLVAIPTLIRSAPRRTGITRPALKLALSGALTRTKLSSSLRGGRGRPKMRGSPNHTLCPTTPAVSLGVCDRWELQLCIQQWPNGHLFGVRRQRAGSSSALLGDCTHGGTETSQATSQPASAPPID